MKTYVVGRSTFADIALPDTSVAPRQAEVLRTDDGRFYVTDCASEHGTWYRDGQGHWTRLRQRFVTLDEPLRLGEHPCTLRELLADRLHAALPEGAASGEGGAPGSGQPQGSKPRPRGRVERDPVSGEIIHKRL